ncbi:MAG: thermonuclease family protein [Chromatiaceae bacterium]|nr:thermonuclease family protein [Chromatiaceae bacterium]
MPRPQHLLALLLVGSACLAYNGEQQLPGRVLRVIDGDSLILEMRGSQYLIELAGIDAPEPSQPWGGAATDRLYTTLTGAFVVVHTSDDDFTGPIHGSVIYKGRDVALDMLYDGLAWSTVPTDTSAGAPGNPYTDAEAAARAARRGLWSDDNPVPPWAWRAGIQPNR